MTSKICQSFLSLAYDFQRVCRGRLSEQRSQRHSVHFDLNNISFGTGILLKGAIDVTVFKDRW